MQEVDEEMQVYNRQSINFDEMELSCSQNVVDNCQNMIHVRMEVKSVEIYPS